MENGFKHPVLMVDVKSTNVNETPCAMVDVKSTNVNETPCALVVLNQFRLICKYVLTF